MSTIQVFAFLTERHVEVNIDRDHKLDMFHMTFEIGKDKVTFSLTELQLNGIIDQIGGE